MSSGSTKRREIRRDLLIVGIILFSRLLPRLLVNIYRRYFPTFRLNPDESCEFLVKFYRLLVFRLLVTFPDDVSRLIVPVSRLPTFCVHRYSIKYLGLNLLSFCYTGWFLINCFFFVSVAQFYPLEQRLWFSIVVSRHSIGGSLFETCSI